MQTPLKSATFCLRSSPTKCRETVPNIKFWKSVNKRREVCLFRKLPRNKRTTRELFRGLYDMRELWIKGSKWNEKQPGDDPIVTKLIDTWDQSSYGPIPRLIYSHISWEGCLSFRRWTFPRFGYSGYDYFIDTLGNGQYQFKPADKSGNKRGKVSQVVNATQFKVGMDPGHGLVVDSTVVVTWSESTYGGSRQSVKVVAVSGNTVTFDEGQGAPLPLVNASVVVIKNPSTESFFVYVWSHLNNPNEGGIERVLKRMTALPILRNWNPKFASKVSRKTSSEQGKDQWPNEIKLASYVGSPPIIAASERTPAVQYERFQNLQTGASLGAILRRDPLTTDPDNPGNPQKAMYLDFVVGSNIVRALTVVGITWPGIEYGLQNPDVDFEGEGPLWIPSPDNAITDFPKVVGEENYLAQSSTSPIPLDWMRTAFEVFSENFVNNLGPNYSETPFHNMPFGELTTRTNANSGKVTCSTTGIKVAGTGSLYWNDGTISGSRTGVSITPLSGEIQFTGGSGTDLPPEGTWIQFYSVSGTGNNYNATAFGSTAIEDRLAYHLGKDIPNPLLTNKPNYSFTLSARTPIYPEHPFMDVPFSAEEGRQFDDYPGYTNTLYRGFFTATRSAFIQPSWADQGWIEDRDAYFATHGVTAPYADVDEEHIYYNQQYLDAQSYGWVPTDVSEIVSAGISGPVLQGNFSTGWKNILCMYEILSSQQIAADTTIYDFLSRSASVGSSGSGITNVRWTNPVFEKYGAKIMTWRGRTGKTTTNRYGANLYTASTKVYNRWESMLWFGVTISGPSELVSRTIITVDDIIDTTDAEVTPLPRDYRIQEWDDSAFMRDIQQLQPEQIPSNYIGAGFADMVPGKIYGINSDYTEFYQLYTEYNFGLSS